MDTIYSYPRPKAAEYITDVRNRESGLIPLVEKDTTLKDFYYHYKQTEVNRDIKNRYETLEEIPDTAFSKYEGKFIYEIKFANKGGLVSPLIIQFNYSDGTSDIERIGAYVWRKNEKEVTKTFLRNKKVASILLDPNRETADINERNNTWNIKEEPSKFELFKAKAATGRGQSNGTNPMQKTLKK